MGEFKSLLYKNYILFKRKWLGSFIEIFIPIFFAICLFIIRIMFPPEEVPGNSLISNPDYSQAFPSYQGYKNYTQLNNQTFIKNCTNNIVNGQLIRNGVIALGPPSDPIIQSLQKQFIELGYQTYIVSSNHQIDTIVKSADYGKNSDNPSICFAIFIDSSQKDYKFRIRFNISDSLDSQGPSTFNPIFSILPQNYYTALLTSRISGLFQVNSFILNEIFQKESNNRNLSLLPFLSPMGFKTYMDDKLFAYIKDFIDVFTLFPTIIIFLRMTSSMLSQKQKRIRQIMKTMGMSPIYYYGTWIIKYFLIYLTTHIFSTLVFYKTLNYLDYSLMLVTFVIFDCVLIVQSLFIQTFFIQSVLGTLVALTFFFIQYIGSFIVKSIESPTNTQIILGSICPFSSMLMIMQEIFFSISANQSLTWGRFSQKVMNYRVVIGIISLILNLIVWSVLTIYLEQIIPNEEGTRKHPLFLCGFPRNVPDTSFLRCSITSLNLSRKFSVGACEGIHFLGVGKIYSHNKKVAVKNLNFQIQSNSIFTLLGHNGAGKTTTLSMLAGITSMSSGDIVIMGKSIKNDSQELRKMMGFCPQHNTLYEDLTVLEHLRLFATFKEKHNDQDLQYQIKGLLEDLDLVEKKNEFPKNLSGGQKRRLQLSLAFVGGSSIVFLDEPTSGLDSYTRRRVWSFLKKKRTGKIIILTTHFMDQAEALSDGLGIMKEGQLVCHGTPYQLKKRYNLGYRLNIQKMNCYVSSQPIIQMIKNIFKNAHVQSVIPSELTFEFPVQDQSKFVKLFDLLDKNKRQLGILGYGVNTSTLQQVLLHVTANQSQEYDMNQIVKEQTVSVEDHISTQNNINPTVDKQSNKLENQIDKYKQISTENQCFLFFRHIWLIISKRFRLTLRNIRLLLLQIIVPIALVVIVLGIQKGLGAQEQVTLSMTPSLYEGKLPVKYIITGNTSDQFIQKISTQLQNDHASKVVTSVQKGMDNLSLFDTEVLIPNRSKQLLGGIYLRQKHSSYPNVTAYFIICNTNSVYSPLVSLNTISGSLINEQTSTNISINMLLNPLPLTQIQKTNFYNPTTSFLVSIIFSIALAYKYSSIISQMVKQRSRNCKHLQIMSGMTVSSYWLGNFIFDYALYTMFAIVALTLCKAFSVLELIGSGAVGVTILVFILYGITQLLFTYLCSFLFSDHSNAQSLYYFLNFMAGAMLPIIVLIFRYIGGLMANVGLGIAWAFRIIPSFAFGEALVNLMSIGVLSYLSKKNYKPMDLQIALYDVYYLGMSIPVLIFLIFFCQYFSWESIVNFFSEVKKIHRVLLSRMDSIVQRQVQKTQKADPNVFPVVLKNIIKVYGKGQNKKVAINRLNLSVDEGEVFGLLGINGAGKSTTFKILTKQIIPTSGQVYINGANISRDFEKVKRHIGYCPQFSALFQTLTVKQQLELYYMIKGFRKDFLDQEVERKMKTLNIKKYQNVYSVDLSGGNQRKLSMGIALIGNPKIVLLDEPSTGMDPYSKRYMWKVINDISTKNNKTTVIFTTHSMQQAEYLSTRVGVMVNGNFKCLGTPERIKTKYSDGFFLEIKLAGYNSNHIKKQLLKLNITDQLVDMRIDSTNVSHILDQYFTSQRLQVKQAKKVMIQLCSTNILKLSQLAERMLYQQIGQNLKLFMARQLGEEVMEEHDNKNWKLKIKPNVSLSRVIIMLEKHKSQLKIQQYQINSISLQQILNKFSEQYHQEMQLKTLRG